MARHTTLAQFEFFVLLAVERLGDEAFAGSVRSLIEERAGRDTVLGAVYAALGRLEDKGLVSREAALPIPTDRGRRRKLFRLTSEGRRELRRTENAVLGMIGEDRALGTES